jgi:hypothetical protein
MRSVETFIEQAQRCETVDELGALHVRAMAEEGYANVIFCRVTADGGMVMPWVSVPTGYIETYRAHRFETADPILARLPSSRSLLRWSDVTDTVALTKPEWDVMENSRAMGIHSGISLPFHGPDGQCDIFSMSLRENEPPDPARTPIVEAKTFHTWSRYWHLVNGFTPATGVPGAELAEGERRRFHFITDDRSHRGGPPGMTSTQCRALVLVDVAARRADAGLLDLTLNLSRYCAAADLEYLLRHGLVMEVPDDFLMRYLLAPSVIGRAHLCSCPAAPEFRRGVWEMDVRRRELPKR